MRIYTQLIFMGIAGLMISVYLPLQIGDKQVSLLSLAILYLMSLSLMFILTKKETEKKYNDILSSLKKKYEDRLSHLKLEYDTITLEKTIRDGAQTLIKNALDYFKIENIKNEMPPSAAIQNLQLDKYGQIIELLADFSLILPDYEENKQIVQKEIHHQIEIYQVDEQPFALFLQRIMEKYIMTLNKKLRERQDMQKQENTKECPRCLGKIQFNAKICKFCRYEFEKPSLPLTTSPLKEKVLSKKGRTSYKTGDFEEAIRIFTVFINLNPKASQAFYNRGMAYYKLDKQAEAVKDLKKAVELGHEKARQFLNLMTLNDTQEWDAKEA